MADVIGQEHVTRTLQHAIESGRVAHAYLFVGPRGIGKTTLSRIFAKALNCEHGPTPTPCDECDLCREIMAGNALDVIEIDAASNNGVDNIRDLRDSIQFAPARARYKIYIIDEVHMLSTGAFNALLKTLEEPPPHAKFIFATTEIDKLPATIISRCQRFDLRRIPTTLIVDYLRHIAEEEGVKADGDALLAIARGAEGGMRDALGALDQIISFKGNDVTEQDVLAVFGLVSRSQLENLAAAILKGDMAAGLRIIDDLDRKGKDLRRLAVELMEHFRNLLVRQQLGDDAVQALDVTPEQLASLDAQTTLADSARLLRVTEHLADLESRIRMALSRRTLFETVFLRCCRAATVVSLDQVIKQLATMKTGAAATAGGPPMPTTGGPAAVPAAPRPAQPTTATAPAAPRPAQPTTAAAPAAPRPAQPAMAAAPAAPRPAQPTMSGPAAAPRTTPPPRPPLPPRPAAPRPVPPQRPALPPRPPTQPPAPSAASAQTASKPVPKAPPTDRKVLDNPVVKAATEIFGGQVTDIIRQNPHGEC